MAHFRGLMWWIDRWRKSTAYIEMTLEQQGAYRNLLDEAALRGGTIPNDRRILAKASGDAIRWRFLKRSVLCRFELGPSGYHNVTLDNILERSRKQADRQKRWRNAQRNAGRYAGAYPYPDLKILNTKSNKPRAAKRAKPIAAVRVDWWEECKKLHGGTCEKRWDHDTKKAADRPTRRRRSSKP